MDRVDNQGVVGMGLHYFLPPLYTHEERSLLVDALISGKEPPFELVEREINLIKGGLLPSRLPHLNSIPPGFEALQVVTKYFKLVSTNSEPIVATKLVYMKGIHLLDQVIRALSQCNSGEEIETIIFYFRTALDVPPVCREATVHLLDEAPLTLESSLLRGVASDPNTPVLLRIVGHYPEMFFSDERWNLIGLQALGAGCVPSRIWLAVGSHTSMPSLTIEAARVVADSLRSASISWTVRNGTLLSTLCGKVRKLNMELATRLIHAGVEAGWLSKEQSSIMTSPIPSASSSLVLKEGLLPSRTAARLCPTRARAHLVCTRGFCCWVYSEK